MLQRLKPYLIGLLTYRFVRGTGEVQVSINLDPGSHRPAFTVCVSRSRQANSMSILPARWLIWMVT